MTGAAPAEVSLVAEDVTSVVAEVRVQGSWELGCTAAQQAVRARLVARGLAAPTAVRAYWADGKVGLD